MKKLIYFCILIAFISINSYAQNNNPLHNWEVTFFNETIDTIEVFLQPVSAVYNGYEKYSFVAMASSISYNGNSYNYINGVYYLPDYEIKRKTTVLPGYGTGWQVDITPRGNDNSLGAFGYGMYKLIVKNLRTERVDSSLMELDLGGLQQSDLFFYLCDDVFTNHYGFGYRFDWAICDTCYVPINYDSLRGYLAIPWEPNSFINNNHVRPKNFGNFLLKNYEEQSLNYNAEYFPLDSRIHCNYINTTDSFYLAQNHVYPYPLEEPQVGYYDERHGILNLNLTIKRRVITPPYRSNFSVGSPNPTPIVVSPGVTLSVLQNELTDNPNSEYVYNGIVLGKYNNDNVGIEMIVKSANDKYSAGKLFLGPSTDTDSNNRVVINSYSALKLEPTSILELGNKAEIDIELSSNNYANRGKLIAYNNSNIITHPESKIIARQVGEFENYGANIVNSNNFHIDLKDGAKYSIKAENYTHTVSEGAYINLVNGNIEIANNSTLSFDGSSSYLSITNNSSILLGENAKIEFKNGAYLIADGSAISSAQGSHGSGIVLENAGEQTSITNCTFTNLKNSIFVKNTVAGYFGTFKNISNNTFYTDANCNYVIETKNANNITISNNHVSMTQGKGVGILMRYYINQGNEETPSPTYAVNVMGNEISNGVVSAAFISFTNSYPYINFKYNYCNGSVSNTNIAYRQTYGNIKYNFIANSSGKNLDLIQAHPDVFSNTFESYIMNVTINDSYPYFAPISTSSDGGWVWRGGKNTLTSTSNGNIYYNNGNALLDWGQNIFYKSYYNFHLQGRINEPSGIYYVRNNCFNGSNIPGTSLRDYYSDTTVVIPYYEGSNFSCNTSDAGTIWLIDDLGNGFYDTLYSTNDNSGYQPDEDEGLYSSAIENKLNDENYGAVSTFKTLINLHPQSVYTEECLYSLYECYQKLDTSRNQTSHDILYSDLKYFLDSKIASGLYSDEFNLNAYNITVMCLASISKYYEAMSGYEFIALYHPDEYLSFLASYDYAEIEDLMNGSGGISSKEENMTQEEYYKKLKKRIDRKIDDDPVKKMVKKSFDRTKAEKFSKIEKDAASRTNSNETAKQEIARIKSKYDEAKMKAVSIMRTSKSLTREEKDRKQIEDILLTKTEENKESATFSNIVPDEYSISQNYPNPFNPNTKINFALPKQGFVSLKIYDITGREIKTLVNEVKQAGYYTVDFNGSNLSSGVYFYKIQSGDFSSVKRMVLVK